MTIYGRVMTFYQDKQAEGVGLVLWGDLKVLIDSPEVNDVDGLIIHMFVDKKYPLSVNLIERMLDHQLEIFQDTVVASPEQTATGKDTSNPFMAVMTCQKSYSSSTYYDSCSESGKWFQSSMDLTLSGLDVDFLVADSKFMKVAFGDGFKMSLFNPLVISMKDLSRNLKLTMSNSSLGEDFPTGKDNSIVSTGSTKVIPAGRAILFLVVLCLLRVVSKS
ncbi:hypothetical protein Tco_1427103 [Tanacetum coccineum]